MKANPKPRPPKMSDACGVPCDPPLSDCASCYAASDPLRRRVKRKKKNGKK